MLLATLLLLPFIRVLNADSQYSCNDGNKVARRNGILIEVACGNNTCDWRKSDYSGEGNSESEIIDPKSLTIQQIIDYCGSHSLSKCVDDSTDKSVVPTNLVWRDDCSSCPMCPCDKSKDDEPFYFAKKRSFFKKSCYKFTCKYDYSAKKDAWQASYPYTAYGPKTLAVFDCPPLQCTNDNGQTYNLGSTWWDNTECTKFCVCALDGSKAKMNCETGFDKIIGEDSTVKDDFARRCEHQVAHCMHDATRLEKSGNSYYCNYCPKCKCGKFDSINESYYQELSSYNSNNFHYVNYNSQSRSCYKCKCKDDEMDCDQVEHTDNKNYDMQCPSDFKCYEGHEYGDLELDNCDSNAEYCEISVSESDNESGFIFGNEEWWGCSDDGMNCRLYGEPGSCHYLEFSGELKFFNCTSLQRTTQYVTARNYKNCTGEQKNNIKLDKTKCTKNAVVSQGYTKFIECAYQDQSLFFTEAMFCSVDDESLYEKFNEVDVCKYIESVVNLVYVCMCSAFGSVWEDLDSEQKKVVLDFVDNYKDSQEYVIEWADYYDCEVDLTCHLTSDSKIKYVTFVSFKLSMPWANSKHDDETITQHLLSKVTTLTEESIMLTSGSVKNGVYTASVKVYFLSKTQAELFSSNLEDDSVYCFGDSDSDCGSVDAESISISTDTIDVFRSDAGRPMLFMIGGVLLLAQFIFY